MHPCTGVGGGDLAHRQLSPPRRFKRVRPLGCAQITPHGKGDDCDDGDRKKQSRFSGPAHRALRSDAAVPSLGTATFAHLCSPAQRASAWITVPGSESVVFACYGNVICPQSFSATRQSRRSEDQVAAEAPPL